MENKGPWSFDSLFISGVHTGWRIVRGAGESLEVDSIYPYDRYEEGDKDKKFAEAIDRFIHLTKS